MTRGSAVWVALCAACAGSEGPGPTVEPALLVALPGLLVPRQVVWEGRLVGEGPVPRLALVRGTLPEGLSLGLDGVVRGLARSAGEVQRFTVGAWTDEGVPAGQREYVLAVGCGAGDLPGPPTVKAGGDVVEVEAAWGRGISKAFAVDPVAGLVWPLEGGFGVRGRILTPVGGRFTVVATGAANEGLFDLEAPPPVDAAVLVQLTWKGEADVDLRVLREEAGLSTEAGRRVIEAGSERGAEAVVLGAGDAGQFAVVATRVGGSAVAVELAISVRDGAGKVLADRVVDGLFSDAWVGPLEAEVAAKRQSYRVLGYVRLDGGRASWSDVAGGGSLQAGTP